MPDVLPSILALLLANLLAAIALSILPALGVLALLYADFRARLAE